MLTNPLHHPEWLAFLRQHKLPAYQLMGHLLTDTGSKLTAEWLDKLCQNGPRTGIPGLYTIYDTWSFSVRYESLIEEILHIGFQTVDVPPEYMAISRWQQDLPQTKCQRRTRRARVAVFMAAMTLEKQYPLQLAQARSWELHRHTYG